jgi:hypothetical protein
MGSPFHQRALRRKIIYIVLIVVLFTVAMLFRVFPHYGLEAQGQALALREQDVGEVELSGRAVQLSLTGLRGWASCILWKFAMDLQMKNKWDELEVAVRSITKLQPHFITPWLFQSWNLSYNVAVQCDLPRDKYYYISRGIDLLAEGERQNQYQPELRFAMGTYYQQKISMHDHRIPLQALFEMSSIDPLQRQSHWFWAYGADNQGRPMVKTDKTGRPIALDLEGREILPVDVLRPSHWVLQTLGAQSLSAGGVPVAGPAHQTAILAVLKVDPFPPIYARARDQEHRPRFEVFCEDNPRLARRLRDQLGFTTEKQAVSWLDENLKIPSLYSDRIEESGAPFTPFKLNKEGPFPVLPPKDYDPEKYKPLDPPWLDALGRDRDAFAAARAWYVYAVAALPPPDPEIPGQSEKPIVDPVKHREPQHMTTVIFRNYPARAQSYVAERLEEEGCFDETGWKLVGWFRGDRFSTGDPAMVGVGRKWAESAWEKAHGMWQEHGSRSHLDFTNEQVEKMQKQTKLYRDAYGVVPGAPPRPLRLADLDNKEMVESYKTYVVLVAFGRASQLSNFRHFLVRSDLERQPKTVEVRKAIYEAEQLKGTARALPKYEAALKDWAAVLEANPDFRQDDQIQEDSYEDELNYLQLLQDTAEGRVLKQQLFVQAYLGQQLAPSPETAWLALAQSVRPQAVGMPIILGPLDRDDKQGNPLIAANTREGVLRRKGLIHTSSGPPPGMQMPGMPTPPGMGGPGKPPPLPPARPGVGPQP